MLVERLDVEGRRLVATGRLINGSDEEAVLAAWKNLCYARRNWYKAHMEEMDSSPDGENLLYSDAHQKMVGPAQKAYESLVGPKVKIRVPARARLGVGEIYRA